MNQSAIWKEEKKNRLKASFHFVQYELSQESNLAHTVKQRKKWSHVGCKMWLAFFLCFQNPEEDTKRLVELRAWCFDDKLFMHLSPGSKMRTWKIKADLRHNEYIKGQSGWSGSGSLREAEWMCLKTWTLQTEGGQGYGLLGHKTVTSRSSSLTSLWGCFPCVQQHPRFATRFFCLLIGMGVERQPSSLHVQATSNSNNIK